jgi:hypothetical protein
MLAAARAPHGLRLLHSAHAPAAGLQADRSARHVQAAAAAVPRRRHRRAAGGSSLEAARCCAFTAPALQIGYITSEIWREGQTCFSLDHRMADTHDVNGSTLCARLPLPSTLRVMPQRCSQVHLVHGGAPQPAGQASGGVVCHAPYTAGSAAMAAAPADTRSSRSVSPADCCCRSLPSTLPCAACSSSSTRAGRRRRPHTRGSGGTARRARCEQAVLMLTHACVIAINIGPPPHSIKVVGINTNNNNCVH